jgi:hypothetical protein
VVLRQAMFCISATLNDYHKLLFIDEIGHQSCKLLKR